MSSITIPQIPTIAQLVDKNGMLNHVWIQFFSSLIDTIQEADAALDTKIGIISGDAGNLIQISSSGTVEDAGVSANVVLINQADAQTQASDTTLVTAIAGSDTINLATLNASLLTLQTEINAIVDVVNGIITKMQNAGLMEES